MEWMVVCLQLQDGGVEGALRELGPCDNVTGANPSLISIVSFPFEPPGNEEAILSCMEQA